MVTETKIDSSFPSAQFQMHGYTTPYRLDRNANGGGLLLYVREDIPTKKIYNETPIKKKLVRANEAPFMLENLKKL